MAESVRKAIVINKTISVDDTGITVVENPSCSEDTSVEHTWMVYEDGSIGCRDCLEVLAPKQLLEVYTEYDRIVKTGISVLQGELEDYRRDFEAAAAGLEIPIDQLPPGSDARLVVISNRLISHELHQANIENVAMLTDMELLHSMIEAGQPHVELAAFLERALKKVGA